MQGKPSNSVTWMCSKGQRSTDAGDKDLNKTEEALKNSFAGLDELKCAATSKEPG